MLHIIFISIKSYLYLDSIVFQNRLTDVLKPGSFIAGDLNVLGWAIHRGVDFDDIIMNKFNLIAEKNWQPLKFDENRKYCCVP